MSAPAKRVQFFLKEEVLAQVEQLGAEYDKSLSAICGQLIKEALATRGLLDYEVPSADFSPLTERPKAQELLGSEPWYQRWKDTDPEAAEAALKEPETGKGAYIMQKVMEPGYRRTAKPPTTETLTRETSTSIQEQKLQLMQELMEQLKTL